MLVLPLAQSPARRGARKAVSAVWFSLLAEDDGRLAGILVVIAEVDGIAAASIRIALAAQVLRMHRHQELVVAKTDEFVVGAISTLSEGKASGMWVACISMRSTRLVSLSIQTEP